MADLQEDLRFAALLQLQEARSLSGEQLGIMLKITQETTSQLVQTLEEQGDIRVKTTIEQQRGKPYSETVRNQPYFHLTNTIYTIA